MDNPDFLIVGGGSAGATLASLLSEDPATRVMLVEAGDDTLPNAVPADIADTFPSSSLNPGYFWSDVTAVRMAGEAPRPFPQARVMGGGSSVMGLWALRGLPSDFDAWVAAGADGWGWSDVVKCYRRLERDLDRDRTQTAHGSYPIRRLPAEEWPAFVTAIERAGAARGLRSIADINENPADGFFPMPLSQDAQRASSARCYLTSAVRRRGNLAIAPRTLVTGLRLDGDRVVGVTAVRNGELEQLSAREVILSAGAIHSPAMLLRAGIGPAGHLRHLGITPVRDRPGVGRNLQNHMYLHFALTLPPGMRLGAELRRFAIAGLRHSSGLDRCPAQDLLLFTIGRVSPHPYGPDLAMVGAALYSPFSRGKVTLTSPDSAMPPRVEFRMLEDFAQPAAHAQGSAVCRRSFARPHGGERLSRGLSAAVDDVAAPVQSAGLGRHGARTRCQGGAQRPGAGAARKHSPADPPRPVVRQPPSPIAAVGFRAAGSGGSHGPSGRHVRDWACRRSDGGRRLRMPSYGVRNLRVVDASIMPRIPSANTNLPAIMVAHRAAELIRSQTETARYSLLIIRFSAPSAGAGGR